MEIPKKIKGFISGKKIEEEYDCEVVGLNFLNIFINLIFLLMSIDWDVIYLPQEKGVIRSEPILGGLHHHYYRVAA